MGRLFVCWVLDIVILLEFFLWGYSRGLRYSVYIILFGVGSCEDFGFV